MNPLQTKPLLAAEKKAIGALGALMAARMLGLFMVLPVFSIYGGQLAGATPLTIGLAVGVYGLMQAVLQIPFGVMSDRFGRKRILLLGLSLFFIGGLVAAAAEHIALVVAGRALQGAGAIASVVMAAAADATREEQRTKAMAMIGMSIGVSFVLALVVGPLIADVAGLRGLFLATSLLALLGIVLVIFVLPQFTAAVNRDQQKNWREAWRNKEVRRVSFGVFILHWVMTAVFLVLPLALLKTHGIQPRDHSLIYLPTMILSFLAMIPLVIYGEKKRKVRFVMVVAVSVMALAELFFLLGYGSLSLVVVGLFAFFFGFNLLEAMLPSLVSKLAPIGQKGGSMGIYSSAQFIGAFVGGVGGGLMSQYWGLSAVFLVSALMLLLWLVVLVRMPEPPAATSVTLRLPDTAVVSVDLEAQLLSIEGVQEVVVYSDDHIAIIKADKKKLDIPTLQSVLDGNTISS